MAQRKLTIGVIFGGRSVEHDVSVVTGQQVMRAFDANSADVVPIYIDRNGRWFTGEPLRDLRTFSNEPVSVKGVQGALLSPSAQHHGLIVNPTPGGLFAKSQVVRLDVVFPALHGSHGEDGTIQGLCELADIPYAGCGVMASAVANDKLITKMMLRAAGIPVTDDVSFTRAEWHADPDAIIARITATLAYPVFVKPVTLGSSIGIGRAGDEALLRASIDVAANLDSRILVEAAVPNVQEINCAVLGDERTLEASVLEQPVSWAQFLTYEEKYLRGDEGMKSAERIIPAPLDEEQTATIRDMALRAFRLLNGRGTARLDFLVDQASGAVYLNEINTLPGSFAFYLWQAEGMSARQVVERLVEIARHAHSEKRQNTYNYQTNLISLTQSRGLKGAKGKLTPTR